VQIARREWERKRHELLAAGMFGYENLFLGDFPRARDELKLAGRGLGVQLTDVLNHESAVVSLATLPIATWFTGDAEQARIESAAAVKIADALDPAGRRTAFTQAYVNSMLAWHAQLDGAFEQALAFADRSIAIASARGYVTWVAAATLHRCIALCSLGRLDEGLPALSAMVQAWRSAGRDPSGEQRHQVLSTPYFAGQLAEALLASGDVAGSRAEVDRALAGSAANGERFWDVELLRLRAALRRLAGEPVDDVTADLHAARELAALQGAGALAARLPASGQPIEETVR
jgi:hypothetical protein